MNEMRRHGDFVGEASYVITPEGYMKIKGTAAVVGPLVYQREDGELIEHVTEQALISGAESLVGKAVTSEHPTHLLSSENTREVSRGTVMSATYNADTQTQDVEIIVQDAAMIRDIKSFSKIGLSPGYLLTERKRNEDGSWQQVTRVSNHLAIVEKPRGGSKTVLRLDSAGHTLSEDDMSTIDELKKRVEVLESQLSERNAKISTLEALQSEVPTEDQRMDSMIQFSNERREIETAAQRFGVELNFEGASNANLKRQVLASRLDDARMDSFKSDVEVGAAFEALIAFAPTDAPTKNYNTSVTSAVADNRRSDSEDVDESFTSNSDIWKRTMSQNRGE